eukprot:11469687-Alexandrium_andersonii.AAC.1
MQADHQLLSAADAEIMDNRFEKAKIPLRKIGMLDLNMEEKAVLAEMVSASRVNVGLSVSPFTHKASSDYVGQVRQAVLSRGQRAWTCNRMLFTIILRGHRLDARHMDCLLYTSDAADDM